MEKLAGSKPHTKAERMEVFLALVEAQDSGASVAQTRKDVIVRFGITDARLRRIEQEGIDAGWPPL